MRYLAVLFASIPSIAIGAEQTFEGIITTSKDLPIRVMINCDRDSDVEIQGLYQYQSVGTDISLTGQFLAAKEEGDGYLMLGERNDSNITGVFALTWRQGLSPYLDGTWTNFKNTYSAVLKPIPRRVFQDGEYSTRDFTLDALPYSHEESNLLLSFGEFKNIPVGTEPNCTNEGGVEYAWLNAEDDGSYSFRIREVFTGIPGERFRDYTISSTGKIVN